ncbi:DUF1801 domain-containing protein [soil metagenome]
MPIRLRAVSPSRVRPGAAHRPDHRSQRPVVDHGPAPKHAVAIRDYLDGLPEDRRATMSALRDVVVQHLPAGYTERVSYNMISYTIPLASYPNTYNGQPLCYAAIAAQKSHFAVYLMGAYTDPGQAAWIAEAFRKRGKTLNMGKSCLRFKKLDDVPLDVLGEAIASLPPAKFIRLHEQARKT